MDDFIVFMTMTMTIMFGVVIWALGFAMGSGIPDYEYVGIIFGIMYVGFMICVAVGVICVTDLGDLCNIAVVAFMLGGTLMSIPLMTVIGNGLLVWFLISPFINGGIVFMFFGVVFVLLCKSKKYFYEKEHRNNLAVAGMVDE